MKCGEIWRVEFDPSVEGKIRKTRPGVIVSNDAANRNLSRVVVVVPVTSNVGRQYPGEALVMIAGEPGMSNCSRTQAASIQYPLRTARE